MLQSLYKSKVISSPQLHFVLQNESGEVKNEIV